jgi:hypothetical protein
MQNFRFQILGGANGGLAAAVSRDPRRDLAFQQGHSTIPVVTLLLTKCDPTDSKDVRIRCLPSRPHGQTALPANPGGKTHSVFRRSSNKMLLQTREKVKTSRRLAGRQSLFRERFHPS